ncbi:SAM-dependent methyltransferase [Rhizobium sp. NRK18]|uniref:SAM-dependent methyltransferase n=1 Tax=Rhizobium sp. NRK18 TaxID=2964667 RepID=UPI0021C2F363|nr:cyclopropane-fatty-acyl-phospholipid synthase family protein [Rhizobium sp. NRK18]MCQ2005125.1 cyclopropane-fatty-acyl-phospholipid synthase family protein [Rhizobium sp. NRK18]
MALDFNALVRQIIRVGTLRVQHSDGSTEIFGDGSGAPVAIRFTDDKAAGEIAADPPLKLGEVYMDGRMVFDEGDIYSFLALVKSNTVNEVFSPLMMARLFWRMGLSQALARLPVNHNRQNVSHHYDLSAKLFDLFLDPDWQYSCAYFEPADISLEEAQLAKKRHIAAKLLMEQGQKVLEIGSGWGGMAMYLAEAYNADVTGITLSHEQLDVSRRRAEKRNLADRVRFELQDYRYYKDKTFDRIVSVGMFEHVGVANYAGFFRKCAELLDKDGVMVLHSIGRPKPSYATNPFIEKYIFPGGYIPSVGEVAPHVEKAGLLVKDVEILSIHYAETLKAWRERFLARKEEAVALYDERFVRMWEFYLAGSEIAFRYDELFVFQMQIARQQYAVPNNRTYIAEREAGLKTFEASRAPLEKVEF